MPRLPLICATLLVLALGIVLTVSAGASPQGRSAISRFWKRQSGLMDPFAFLAARWLVASVGKLLLWISFVGYPLGQPM